MSAAGDGAVAAVPPDAPGGAATPAPQPAGEGPPWAGWPWAAQVALGVVLVPLALLSASGALWLLALALRPLLGEGGPLEGSSLAVIVVLWAVVPAAVGAAAWSGRRRRARPDPVAQGAATAGGDEHRAVPHGEGGTGAATAPGWATRLAELAVGLTTVAVVVWPFARAPGAPRWVGATDAPYSAWLGWRIGRAMRDGIWLPTTVPDALWPAGVDLLVTDGLLPAYVTGLLNAVGLGPYASYNVALALGVGLNVWAGRRLGLALTDRRWVALGAGIAYATATAVSAPVQAHVAFVWSFALPLLVRRAVLDARGPDPVRPLVLTGLLVLAFLCSAYHLVFGAMAYGLVGLLWPGSRLIHRAALTRVAAGVGLALLVLSPFVAARWSFEADERAAGGGDQTRVADAFLLSADALSAVTPPEELLLSPPGPRPSLGPAAFASLRIAFPGALVLAGAGVAVVLRRRGALALVGAAGVLWLLSLGPALHLGGRYPLDGSLVGRTAWLPFRLLLEVPGLGNLRAPYRASYAIAALLTAATVLGLVAVLEHLERRATLGRSGEWGRRAARRQVAVVVVALAVLSVVGPLPTSDLALTEGQRAALEEVDRRGGPGEAVLVVPFGCRLDDPRIIALQIVHGQPSLGCSTSRAATPWAAELGVWGESEALASLWCGEHAVGLLRPPGPAPVLSPGSIEELRAELGVRFVILDRGGIDPARCPWLVEGLPVLEAHELLGDDGGWAVLDLAVPERS